MDTWYEDEAQVRDVVANGGHRNAIGGMWDELGEHQLRFLIDQGLRRDHTLLDLGCGALRAGVKLAPYLEWGHYYGLDISRAMLDAGRGELDALGISARVPPSNLRASPTFCVSAWPQFDFAIAQSLFTHLRAERLADALGAVAPNFDRGTLFATFFVAPAGVTQQRHTPGDVTTFADRDPFHTTPEAVGAIALSCGWSARWIGDWGHPRDQQMCALTKTL